MNGCRGCGETALSRVLDLGKVPAADHFPLATDPVRAEEASHRVGHGRVPRLRPGATGRRRHGHRRAARRRAAGAEGPGRGRDRAGRRGGLAAWGHRRRVRQPARWHVDPAARRAWVHYGDVAADVVLDCFGIMHEPDQRSAFARRAAGHRAGRGAAAAVPLDRHDRRAGPMECVAARAFRVLLADHADAAARRGRACGLSPHGSSTCTAERCCSQPYTERPNPTSLCCASSRPRMRWASPTRLPSAASNAAPISTSNRCGAGSKQEADGRPHRARVRRCVAGGRRSSAAPGIDSRLLAAVADASPAKQGRRMPGTDIPIVSPDELLAAKPDRVLLTLPDLLPEVSARFPELDGRWKVDGQ